MYLNIIKATNLMAIVMVTAISVWAAFVMEVNQKRLDLINQEQVVFK